MFTFYRVSYELKRFKFSPSIKAILWTITDFAIVHIIFALNKGLRRQERNLLVSVRKNSNDVT